MSYLIDSDWVADYLKGRESARTLLDPLFADGLAICTETRMQKLRRRPVPTAVCRNQKRERPCATRWELNSVADGG